MKRLRAFTLAVGLGALVVASTPAGAATPAQFGQKCKAAWTGKPNSPAVRAYQPKCVAAARAATNAATDAGNPTAVAGNAARSRKACGTGFPTPRNTPAKRLAFASCVTAANAAQKAFGQPRLIAFLNGANEVPAAGSASGVANIRLNAVTGRVCFTIGASGLNSPVNAAHIHSGAASVSGPPIISLGDLSALRDGTTASGCITGVSADLITSIRANPADYYVNIHTDQFGGGAARGQLTR
jgi:CHRD domain